jgi:CubicO group peptidase (beta-lactamase class C family)
MQIYSDFAAHRSRQIAADVLALAAIAAWIGLGAFVYSLVSDLARFGRQMQSAGADFSSTMTDIGGRLSGVPLIGGGISEPFTTASGAGQSLEAAGRSQQEAVQNLATGLGWGIALVPIVTILLFWLVPRLRFTRRAGTTRRILGNGVTLDMLALRALTNQKLSVLAAVDADPVSAWRRGDPLVMRSLAELELRSSGVRLP